MNFFRLPPMLALFIPVLFVDALRGMSLPSRLALLSLLIYLSAALCPGEVQAEPESTPQAKVQIEVIARAGCRHCAAEKAFLDALQSGRSDIEVHIHDIATLEGSALFKAVVAKYRLPVSLPITLVGTDLLQGFDAAQTTGRQIEQLIDKNRGRTPQGFAALLQAPPATAAKEPVYVHIPGFGELDLAFWPLPAIAVALGFLDGFNPCAMWVLVTFLVVLLQIGSRRRMWMVAGLFIAAESVMYFLILNLWFRLWDFIGMDRIVTPIVGMIAMGGGVFFIYEGWKAFGSELACRVTNLEQRSHLVARIKQLSSGEFGLLAALGIIGLAFSVNVIEFACSIGYPQAFTKIIELNHLNFWNTEALISLYTLFYMADDFAVFGLALWGFDKLQLGRSYARWTLLGGGLLMLLLGMLMVFRPEALRLL